MTLINDGVYEPADGETPGVANADQVYLGM
jgi:hypothetical protein